MDKIKKLDESVINRIAAGEVIQRPHSAIKELIENSIDAGSTTIAVTIKGGNQGINFLQIQDNGHGINRSDLNIVCERFTTSKLTTFDDLKSVSTFGFRGEALASISHVAHITILSRTAGSNCAYKSKFLDGKLVPLKVGDKAEPKPCAGTFGTTITAEDLFYNMPARKEALKHFTDEYQRILEVLMRYSIHFHTISFICKKHGNSSADLHTMQNSSAIENIKAVYGSITAKELISITHQENKKENNAINTISNKVSFAFDGFISNPNFSSKKSIYIFFINHRLVECPSIRKVIDSIYNELLPKKSHPFIYLSLRMPLHHVDVNVHPTKREVHFLFEDELLERIHSLVSSHLRNANNSRQFQMQSMQSMQSSLVFDHQHPIVIPSNSKQLVIKQEERTTYKRRKEDSMDSDEFSLLEPLDGTVLPASHELKAMESSQNHSDSTENESNPHQNASIADVIADQLIPESMLITSIGSSDELFFIEDGNNNSRIPLPKTINQRKSTISANKLVRIDPSLVKIDTIFKKSYPLDGQSDPIQGRPDQIDSKSYPRDEGYERMDGKSDPIDLTEGQDNAFCVVIKEHPSGTNCQCCLPKTTSIRKRNYQNENESSNNLSIANTSSSSSTSYRKWSEIAESPCQLSSIESLRNDVHIHRDAMIEGVLKSHTWVGVVDSMHSLVQYGTKLLIINHSVLLQHLFYQLSLRQFGNFKKLRFSTPIPLQDVIQIAMERQSSKVNGSVDNNGYINIRSATCVYQVKVDTMVKHVCDLLCQKADLLLEYFGIEINENERNIHALPVILPEYSLLDSAIPDFLLELATETDWDDELNCFKTIIITMAKYYSKLQTMIDINETTGRDSISGYMLTDSAKELLVKVLWPAIVYYLTPPTNPYYCADQNLKPYVSEMGGTLCRILAYRSQLPRNYLRDCEAPTCKWDNWHSAIEHPLNSSMVHVKKAKRDLVVLSYAHNGFGNQLWEHSVAFMMAESLGAKFYIGSIPNSLSPGGAIPPNTFVGTEAMERLLPIEFHYDKLSINTTVKQLCEHENFYLADRPIDWRDKNYSTNFKKNLHDLLADTNHTRCLKTLGYFQNLPLCNEDVKSLWTTKLFLNYTAKPGPNDISIYLRCMPRHYHFNDKIFYETILNNTQFDRVWLFQAPECPTRLNPNPSKDGFVASVVRLLQVQYNATRWPVLEGTQYDDTDALLHDLAGLIQSNKLILPVSTWAFWAGFLSNASEIHVNAPPHHSLMPDHPQYVYHNEKSKEYFGKFDNRTEKIQYLITPSSLSSHHPLNESSKTAPITKSNSISVRKHNEHVSKVLKHHHDGIKYVVHPNNVTNTTSVIKSPQSNRLPIVFVYTVVPAVCHLGLPRYIQESIKQALYTQPDCDIIMASNFADCKEIEKIVQDIPDLILFDTARYTSNRTIEFANASSAIFQKDNFGELWMTSALRFFIMEDMMIELGYNEIVHVEADNLLYGSITSILSILRKGYRGLAATPLNANKSFITASVLWIPSLAALVKFSNFLLDIATNRNQGWIKYLKWLRPLACCRQGGVDPDAHGNGIRPFAINEMSMMAYYHNVYPEEFLLFPVVPAHPFVLNRYVCNMSLFGPHGSEVGPPTGHGIWDSNSWGQFIGGTSSKHGRDKGFSDPTHISGQAIRLSNCFVVFLCNNESSLVGVNYELKVNVKNEKLSNSSALRLNATALQCYTLPYVHCSLNSETVLAAMQSQLSGPKSYPYTPLWNLHVHSKHTQNYRSIQCPCPEKKK